MGSHGVLFLFLVLVSFLSFDLRGLERVLCLLLNILSFRSSFMAANELDGLSIDEVVSMGVSRSAYDESLLVCVCWNLLLSGFGVG